MTFQARPAEGADKPGPDFAKLYDRIRESGMNDWVGGADPAAVGKSCFNVLDRLMPMAAGARLLDFGAGVGRIALAVLQNRPEIASLTGIDIVPKMVSFCNESIAAEIPNTAFELLADSNEHYDRFKDDTLAKSRETLTEELGDSFDAAYAFSVFTHIDAGDFVPLLRFVGSLLKPGGHFCFTAFILTPFSRTALEAGWTLATFPAAGMESNGDIFVGNTADRLAFIAYDIRRIEAMLLEAGLISCTIEYGEWRGGNLAKTYQDVVVCRKPHDWKGLSERLPASVEESDAPEPPEPPEPPSA